MEMEGSPVLRKTHHAIHHAQVRLATEWVANFVKYRAFIHRFHHLHRSHTGAHEGGVNRQEEVAINPGR